MKVTNDNWRRFGRWVAEKRDALGMVQAELGEKIGRDRQTIYRIENGSPTKRPTVIKLAEALREPPAVALSMAFGTNDAEPSPTAVEQEILSYVLHLPENVREDVLTMLRALVVKYQADEITVSAASDSYPGQDDPDAAIPYQPYAEPHGVRI